MKGFYLRWGIILLVGLLVVTLGIRRYYREVATIPIEQFVSKPSTQTVRVLGMVQGDSLVKETSMKQATFHLSGNGTSLAVRYRGEDLDSIRELKTLVVVGQWNPSTQVFEAHEIQLLPNYGYVAAAYLIVMIPMSLFLFRMERKVELLYTEIKSAKVYEPEVGEEE